MMQIRRICVIFFFVYDHEELDIWKRSHLLAVEIHASMNGRGRHGPPGLAAQLSRSSMSIAANIAEGAGQQTPAQSVRYIDVAIGSLSETQNHLAFAAATGLILKRHAEQFIDEIRQLRRMCFAFRKWLLAKLR